MSLFLVVTIAKMLLHYLKQTIFHGTQRAKARLLVLITFSNVVWARILDDHIFTSTYINFLETNPISLSLKKQRVVARYSTKAAHRALANATCKTM